MLFIFRHFKLFTFEPSLFVFVLCFIIRQLRTIFKSCKHWWWSCLHQSGSAGLTKCVGFCETLPSHCSIYMMASLLCDFAELTNSNYIYFICLQIPSCNLCSTCSSSDQSCLRTAFTVDLALWVIHSLFCKFHLVTWRATVCTIHFIHIILVNITVSRIFDLYCYND